MWPNRVITRKDFGVFLTWFSPIYTPQSLWKKKTGKLGELECQHQSSRFRQRCLASTTNCTDLNESLCTLIYFGLLKFYQGCSLTIVLYLPCCMWALTMHLRWSIDLMRKRASLYKGGRRIKKPKHIIPLFNGSFKNKLWILKKMLMQMVFKKLIFQLKNFRISFITRPVILISSLTIKQMHIHISAT